MKKRILSLALALACVLSCGAPAWAAEEQVEVQVRKDLAVTLDGKPMQFDGVYPLSEGDRLYLPLRSVGELLGKQVLWFHCPCEVEADNNSLHTDTIYLYDAPATPRRRRSWPRRRNISPPWGRSLRTWRERSPLSRAGTT